MADQIEELNKSKSIIMKANNLPVDENIPYYDRIARFSVLDPYNKFTYGKEYLFFTKPDCHIVEPNTMTLNPVLASDPFFIDLLNRFPAVINQLQSSAGYSPETEYVAKSPFMNLLCNSKTSTLELPGMSATNMDGPTNMWGGTNTYRKDAWASDENIEFSIEFEDTKTLDIYNLLKAYEMYHRYKMAGYIYPPNLAGAPENSNGVYYDTYTAKKELHDVFGVYKIIVDENYMDILYYAYVYGAYFVNVPRDAFNSVNGVTEGMKYTVDFKAFGVSDDPTVLAQFNKLVLSKYAEDTTRTEMSIVDFIAENGIPANSTPNNFNKYNPRMNTDWARYPLIKRFNRSDGKYGLPSTMNYGYRLHWYK